MKICNLFVGGLVLFISAAALADEEQDLMAILQSNAGVVQKCEACRKLKGIGTAKSIPVLSGLLAEERVSHAVCHALEGIGVPEADTALREALGKTSGLIQAGIINSIGRRCDRAAVAALSKMLANADVHAAAVAAIALGRIAGPEALTALNGVKTDPSPLLQAAVDDAKLACAEALISMGDKAGASQIYERMYSSKAAESCRVGAYRGMILAADEKGAVKLIQAGLKGEDECALMASLKMAAVLKSDSVTAALSEMLSSLPAGIQCRVIDVLSFKEGEGVVPVLVSFAENHDPAVRLAAIKALRTVGDFQSVPVLLKLSGTGAQAEKEAARDALVELHGVKATSAIADNIGKVEGSLRLALIGILGCRRDVSALPVLLKLADDADESVRTDSIQSLAMLADENAVADVVGLLSRARTDGQRMEVEKALALICARSTKKEQCAKPVLAALPGADTKKKSALLQVCGVLTGPAVLAVLREGVQDKDAETQGVAVRSLSLSTDPDAIADQLTVARSTSNQTHRVLMLRGCMKLASETTNMTAERRLEACRAVLSLSDRPEEKLLIISCLGKIENLESLKMLETFFADPALKGVAATAALKTAKALEGSQAEAARLFRQKANDVLNVPVK